MTAKEGKKMEMAESGKKNSYVSLAKKGKK